jgi:hypothetical protein
MNTQIKSACYGIFFLLIPSISFSQNAFLLNDSLKVLYKNEYYTVQSIIKWLINKDFDKVINAMDKVELDTKSNRNTYKEVRKKILYSGIPADTGITITFNNKIVNDYVYGGVIMLKNVIFEVPIKDAEINDFNNTLTFEFYTDKESNFDQKTHEYKLNKMYYTSAAAYKERADFLELLRNFKIDSISNASKTTCANPR